MVSRLPIYRAIFASTNRTKVRDRIINPSSKTKVRMKIEYPSEPILASASPKPDASFHQKTTAINRGKSFDAILRSRETEGSAITAPTDKWIEYVIKQGDTLWELAVKRFHVNVKDLIRDNGIKDPRRIQPGQKIRVHLPSYPRQQEVVASWYGQDHQGKPMANGEPFDMGAATIAHKEIPLGTRVELENPATGEKVRAIVTDRGPYVAGRDVDLSYALARKLSIDKKGVGKLFMRVLG